MQYLEATRSIMLYIFSAIINLFHQHPSGTKTSLNWQPFIYMQPMCPIGFDRFLFCTIVIIRRSTVTLILANTYILSPISQQIDFLQAPLHLNTYRIYATFRSIKNSLEVRCYTLLHFMTMHFY